MAIRKRGDKFLVDITVNGVRKFSTEDTEEAAKVAEAKLKLEMLTNTSPVDSNKGWSLGVTYDRCSMQIWKGTPHGKNVAKIYPKLESFFGRDTPLSEIKAGNIDDYVQSLIKKGNANGTINRHTAILSRLFTFAIERRDISKVGEKPHIEHLKEPEGRQRFFSVQEEKAITNLLRHLGYEEQADFVEFLLDTGARVESDALSLTWDCVYLAEGFLVFKDRKCHNTTGIPMTPRVKAMLKKYSEAPNRHALKVWPHKYWWLRGPWMRVAAKLEKQDDSEWIPHTCRHTTASRLVQRGVNLKAVQEFMGHATIQQTQRYSHLAPAHLTGCAEALAQQPKEPTTDTTLPQPKVG